MKLFHLIIFLFIVIYLSSCSKAREEEKLIGSWSKVFLMKEELDSGKTFFWTFDEKQALYTTEYKMDTTVIDTAKFVIDKKFPTTFYIDITGLNYGQDGRYQVIKLNKKILVLERVAYPNGTVPGSYLWKEFVKKTQ